jgi:Ser/Thr protein kinase RdoA (MazF antagonist)
VRTIEIAGAVGAGKSSVVGPLVELLLARGSDAVTLEAAMARLEPELGATARRAAAARFTLAHGPLLILVGRAILRAPIPWWHRRRIFALVLKLGMRLELLRTRLATDTIVVVDEGWLQRALNMFAWRRDAPSAGEIDSYLDRAPLADVVVVVEAPAEVTRERAIARGLPRRLRGRSSDDVDAFLARGHDVLTRALVSLAAGPRGVRVVRVINNGSEAEIPQLLAVALGGQPGVRSPMHRPLLPSLGRPDRLLRRVRRRSSLISPQLAVQVAASSGLADPRPVAANLSPGGRGAVGAVRDDGGSLWLVKRYKESLADADIALEHAVLRRLGDLGLPAPRLRSEPDGRGSLLRVDGDRFALYRFAAGYQHPHERLYGMPDRRRLERLAGQLLGVLHRGLCAFDPPTSSEHGFTSRSGPHVRPTAWFLDRLESFRAVPAADTVFSVGDREWMSAELLRLDGLLFEAGLSRTVIHGDYGPYNLLVRAGREPLAIDWELTRLDWRLTDLATALPRFAGRRTGWDAGAAERFLDGYRSVGTYDAAELSLLPSVAGFLAIRRAIVCIGRFVESRDERWSRQAKERLRLARGLADGRHPLVEVGRS